MRKWEKHCKVLNDTNGFLWHSLELWVRGTQKPSFRSEGRLLRMNLEKIILKKDGNRWIYILIEGDELAVDRLMNNQIQIRVKISGSCRYHKWITYTAEYCICRYISLIHLWLINHFRFRYQCYLIHFAVNKMTELMLADISWRSKSAPFLQAPWPSMIQGRDERGGRKTSSINWLAFVAFILTKATETAAIAYTVLIMILMHVYRIL